MRVGQANTDIHNFGHYLVKLLDTNSLYWDKLESISPDYDLLNDHNETYFVKTDELLEAKEGFIISSHLLIRTIMAFTLSSLLSINGYVVQNLHNPIYMQFLHTSM